MKTTFVETGFGRIACHGTASTGRTVVLVHGNSASSRAYARQLASPVAGTHRLVAIDLPGHGQSQDATDTAAYSLPGYARMLREVTSRLGLEDAVFVGWSLGGHVVLEAAQDLPGARGFLIFGTPPLANPPAMNRGFLPNPAMRFAFAAKITKEEAVDYMAAAFAPGYAEVPMSFLDDVLRTDGRARTSLAASVTPDGYRDEIGIVARLNRPLAVLHGAEEQLVNGAYIAEVTMPTLWRGSVQVIEGAGHTPQWERADVFNALLADFVAETG